jgi:hypothetical protein
MSFAFAQSHDEQVNYYVDYSGDEPRLVQRLIWEDSDYVLRYEVIIEKLEQGRYIEIDRLTAEENFAEVSLRAGIYRYMVEVYDLFDELFFTTEWGDFEIILTFQPLLTGFSPNVFHLDENETWEIVLQGKNLLPESEFYLIQDDVIIKPLRQIVKDDNVTLVFSYKSLIRGTYSVYVKNPGGLNDDMEPFTIKFKKPFDLNFYIGYAPIIPLYGYLFKDADLEAPFSGGIYPLGAVARIGFLPFRNIWGNLGVEASGSFAFLTEEMPYYTTSAYLLNGHLAFIFQRYFLDRVFSFNAVIGIGGSSIIDFHYEYSGGFISENISAHYFSGIAGISVMANIKAFIIANAGFDIIHVFTPPEDTPMPGFIRPFVAVGLQL